MFDYGVELEELRRRSTEWLRAERTQVVTEQRRLHVRELAVTRVLDERGALGTLPDATVSARTAQATIDVARELESLPAIAAAAAEGSVSWDQLQPLVEIATPESDREWARRAPGLAPIDLQRMARRQQEVSTADARARQEARSVRTWRDPSAGMAGGRWWLPDVHGVLVEKVLDHMAERMRPPKGQPWDSRAHRKADALVELCRRYADVEPTGRFKYLVTIQHPVGGVPEVDGIPIAESTLNALLPNAVIREVKREDGRVPRSTKRQAIPAHVERHVRLRDLHCRTPGCEETHGLQLHHVDPVCRGGGNEVGADMLVMVCWRDHPMHEPHGPWRLVGDPEQPDGLRLVHRDEALAEARAGPSP